MVAIKKLMLCALIVGLPLGVAALDPALAQTTAKPADAKPADAKPAGDAKPADTTTSPKPDAKKFTKAQIEAFLSKCSDEADAKGLNVKKGKGAERKVFRRECMHKFGVDPR